MKQKTKKTFVINEVTKMINDYWDNEDKSLMTKEDLQTKDDERYHEVKNENY